MTYELRRAGVPAEMYLGAEKGLGKQIKYADKCGIPLVVIYGSDEKAKGTVTLKDLEAGAAAAGALQKDRTQWRQLRPGQFEVARTDLVKAVKDFTPPLIGPAKIGNFTVWSFPHLGGCALLAAAVLAGSVTRRTTP